MKKPTPDVNVHIGKRLRQQRKLQGLSQDQFAASLGITAAQLDLFERGVERLPPRALIAAAEFSKISIGWFFQAISSSEPIPELSGVNADVVRFLACPKPIR